MSVPFLDLKQINIRDKEALMEAFESVLDSGWYIKGAQVSAFEADFAAYCGASHCLGVANGLDALHLIIEAYKIQGFICYHLHTNQINNLSTFVNFSGPPSPLILG